MSAPWPSAATAKRWPPAAWTSACASGIQPPERNFGGPKGTGALVVRSGTALHARIDGGGQERGRRSGTPNVAGAVGTAAALAATVAGRHADVARVADLRDRLADGLLATVADAVETGARGDRVAGILHLRIAGVEAEAMVVLLDQVGIAASAGAACSSGAVEPSHVLTSMGFGRLAASSGVRFSLGVTTTDHDVSRALARIPGVVDRLRN